MHSDSDSALKLSRASQNCEACELVGVASYPSSTVGPYLECYSGIQVRDPGGETGFYIPYIYVTTNDAALASGREVLGAPKKLAHITLIREKVA
ncbi:acetoacetate decarboxylase family protein [Bradyrhizobium sp. CCBAU 65884]|uniref:acetoacetate decarboxylase family protein n=1 Tax=Bradyrhizobium sp. CCBAU 65884 TaxID=722477 RepID=UPI002306063C|nr:acetoacetate decarboxylase family protein [Bradyrhizobium sp. CCBAU 65884]